jgi:hypothetical protein
MISCDVVCVVHIAHELTRVDISLRVRVENVAIEARVECVVGTPTDLRIDGFERRLFNIANSNLSTNGSKHSLVLVSQLQSLLEIFHYALFGDLKTPPVGSIFIKPLI